MNATTQSVTTIVMAKKFMDWPISSQAPAKAGEGSTTTRNSLNCKAWRNGHECGAEWWKESKHSAKIEPSFIEDLLMPKHAVLESKDELELLYNQLRSTSAVAQYLGMTKQGVSHWLHKHGILLFNRRSVDRAEKKQRIMELLDSGLGKAGIARELGVSKTNVGKLCDELGVTPFCALRPGFAMANGYKTVLANDHPLRDNKSRVREHRIMMESHIGRLLNRNELVHHLNGDKTDNRIENLAIINQAEHMSLHHKGVKNPKKASRGCRHSEDIVSSTSKDVGVQNKESGT